MPKAKRAAAATSVVSRPGDSAAARALWGSSGLRGRSETWAVMQGRKAVVEPIAKAVMMLILGTQANNQGEAHDDGANGDQEPPLRPGRGVVTLTPVSWPNPGEEIMRRWEGAEDRRRRAVTVLPALGR